MPPTLTTESLLAVLPKPRIVELGRTFGVPVLQDQKKEEQIARLKDSNLLSFPQLLQWMGRDELRRACKSHGVDASSRARLVLAERLLELRGERETMPATQSFTRKDRHGALPVAGDIVNVRHRQYLVESVSEPMDVHHLTRVSLVCLDDDNQGRALDVLWELELGARILHPEAQGLGKISRIDPPRHFAAYLHALKWNSVTSTDGRLFQSPFRAGIKILNHQLAPLKKALELPRANLFIADDVGLGKTIEAGLVVQELLLRHRIDYVLIVCPAAIALQWRGEMQRRFGLHFEIYNREFLARRRRERGFGVNPWNTHNRFIISYQTLRRPEYREPLITHLGGRLSKSLLVLDEAHHAAPATATKYAVDSRITGMVRDLSPRFENRLFLSATPHNGHSNSFSSLMELLDPQRFTRGVPIESGSSSLEQVMVRRLKQDLQSAAMGDFPIRKVVRVSLTHDQDQWNATYTVAGKHSTPSASPAADAKLGQGEDVELELSRLLAQYTALMKPKRGQGQLVFTNLQKRLLSSIEAFYRTLQAHESWLSKPKNSTAAHTNTGENEKNGADDEYGQDDDQQDLFDADAVGRATTDLKSPDAEASNLLTKMLSLASANRNKPDAKVRALVTWIAQNQCPGVSLGGAKGKGQALSWSDRRVIIFTEYGDTKRYLTRALGAALDRSHLAEDRIMGFAGAMGDDRRAEVQAAFNSDPKRHPVRILIATDAAREGLNLQSHCADLFHFDVPWNPARIEQRNGRIDRTLQPAKEVRCHYFIYPQRLEDPVLDRLIEKVETIRHELGSLGDVVMERLESALEGGIDADSVDAVDRAVAFGDGDRLKAVRDELESQRRQTAKLQEETDEVGRILDRSREICDFRPALLQDAMNVGLELAGAAKLTQAKVDNAEVCFDLPPLPDTWDATLDSLRRPQMRTEPLWQWRKEKPQPVVFEPLQRLDEDRVHLHLEHPFVQRIMSRFLAQGFSAQDLSRVTVVKNPTGNQARVLAFGRLSLFGPGATRLHDQLVSVAAPWLESRGEGHLRVMPEDKEQELIQRLEDILQTSPSLEGIPAGVIEKLRDVAGADFSALWPAIEAEADAEAHKAEQLLGARGKGEAESLREILRTQKARIEKVLEVQVQTAWSFAEKEGDQLVQVQQDRKHMELRLGQLDEAMQTEPAEIEALYRVTLKRLVPVGLIYLWPASRA
jgi:hypothetical protein